MQKKAHCKYYVSKVESGKLQGAAYEKNFELLKPSGGVVYKKIENISLNRTRNIINYMQEFDSYEELMLRINTICEHFCFGTDADLFEKEVEEIGRALGYMSQRPDKRIGKGPDNLWGIGNNTYIMFECKSQVRMDRREIYKEEVGQMNNHCAWFEKEYKDAKVCRVMIIPTIQVSYQADFTHDVKVLNNEKMDVLRNNIRCFFKEFRDYSIAELDDRYVNECLKEHSLDDQSVFDNYYEKVKAL